MKSPGIAVEQRSLDEAVASFPVKRQWARAVLARLERVAAVPERARVLDIGAASGGFVAACNELGFRCEGIEPWDQARENAALLADHLGTPIHVVAGTAESIPYEADTFDVVHASSVLEHVADLDAALAAQRMLGGRARVARGRTEDVQRLAARREHMLEQVARHGCFDLEIKSQGDLHIDDHHSVEDIGITLGQAFKQALGDKQGIMRYGHAYVPLDEALSRVVIDFSGRPGLEYRVDFLRPRIGQFDVDLMREFFQGFVNHAPATLHIDNLQGRNAHHVAETMFKAFGRALRFAVSRDERMQGVIPSTKGSL